MTDDEKRELSKIGHLEDYEDEVLEGRVVSGYEGPFDWALSFETLREELDRNRRTYRASRMYVSTDGTEWTGVGTAGSVTYGRGPTYPAEYEWLDEHVAVPTGRVTVETVIEDVSPELFGMLTGVPMEVCRVVGAHFGDSPEIPPVDIARVRWP